MCCNVRHGSEVCVLQLDALQSRKEEALMVADAFRIAFEQQLRKRHEDFPLLAQTSVQRSNHCKAEGKSAALTGRLAFLISQGKQAHCNTGFDLKSNSKIYHNITLPISLPLTLLSKVLTYETSWLDNL